MHVSKPLVIASSLCRVFVSRVQSFVLSIFVLGQFTPVSLCLWSLTAPHVGNNRGYISRQHRTCLWQMLLTKLSSSESFVLRNDLLRLGLAVQHPTVSGTWDSFSTLTDSRIACGNRRWSRLIFQPVRIVR